MAENTLISWARHTFNAWIGCTKVSPACKFCYAERDWDHRFHRVKWGPKGARSVTGEDNWLKPARWNREAAALGEIHRVFSNSLSDVMDDHPSIKPEWRARLWDLPRATPSLEWLFLTKRPENWAAMVPHFTSGPMGLRVRLGVSIENQERADQLRPYLEAAHNFGWMTFVSYGPACGPVDWDALMPFVDWLVSEGESGPEARPSHPAWFRQARDACARHGVPFHHKQNGEWSAFDPESPCVGQDKLTASITVRTDGRLYKEADVVAWNFPYPAVAARIGIEKSGRMLDGVLHDAFPESRV